MEVLFAASSAFLAYQYHKNPYPLPLSLPMLYGQEEASGETTAATAATATTAATTTTATTSNATDGPEDNAMEQDFDDVRPGQGQERESEAADGTTYQNNYYPDTYYTNKFPRQDGLPAHPSRDLPRPPLPTNPIDVQKLDDIRNMRDREFATNASGFRPSWVRNTVDDRAPGRQERERDWTAETPRTGSGPTAQFHDTFKHTLNHFGQGGLPFEDQIRVRPDGLDPVAANRTATARFNRYALGDDLTQTTADDGRIRGAAQGQSNRGLSTRQEAWSIMPDRDLQMASGSKPQPLSGAGVRSGGRGASLSTLMASNPVEPLPGMRGSLEWENGATANRGAIDKLPMRPTDDPLDKRFLHEHVEDIHVKIGTSQSMAVSSNKGFRDADFDAVPMRPDVDMAPVFQGLGPRDDLLKATASKAADKTSWRFSYDIKQLFDMPTSATAKNRDPALASGEDMRTKVVDVSGTALHRTALKTQDNNRKEAVPEKRVLFSDAERNDFRTGTAETQQKEADFRPLIKNASTFKGVSVFKTTTPAEENTIASTAIRSSKKSSIETAAPTGTNMSGRSHQFKKSGTDSKRNAVDAGMVYGNDEIFERAGKLVEPRRAPKGNAPDYTQAKLSGARNKGEFRRR